MSCPAQLQINQTGSWRSVLDFDLVKTPPEFLQEADQLVRLASGDRTRMRVVYCESRDDGGKRPTNNVLMFWSRPEGWVNT